MFIKNTTLGTLTFIGKDIFTGTYYEIPSIKLSRWQADSSVLIAIADGTALIAKDDTGSNDITDVNLAISYLKGLPGPTDDDGVPLSRNKITKTGYHYQVHGLEFITSKLASIFNKDCLGNDLGITSIKYYDNTNTELVAGTQLELDTVCVKTIVDWEPTTDIDVIGGILEQSEPTTDDVRIWIVAVPDLPSSVGGSVNFVEGGVNLRYLSGRLDLDGKTPKTMPYDATYHTTKFRMVITHPAGTQEPIHLLFKIFKENG